MPSVLSKPDKHLSLCDWWALHLNIDWKGSQIHWSNGVFMIPASSLMNWPLTLCEIFIIQVINLAQNTCLLLLEVFPSDPRAPLAIRAPGGINRIDGYEERWLLRIGWSRKYANSSHFVNFICVHNSHLWQDELNSKRHPGELWMWQLNPKWMEWNDSERRKQAEVLIGVRFLGREGAEVTCKGKKKVRGWEHVAYCLVKITHDTWRTYKDHKSKTTKSRIPLWSIMGKNQNSTLKCGSRAYIFGLLLGENS